MKVPTVNLCVHGVQMLGLDKPLDSASTLPLFFAREMSLMDQPSSNQSIIRLQTAVGRLESLIQRLDARLSAPATESIDAERYRALEARHQLLRSRVEAAIAGIDRVVGLAMEN